ASAEAPRKGEGQRGHVLPEGDFGTVAAEQVRHRLVRRFAHRVGCDRGCEGPAGIGCAGFEMVPHRVDRSAAGLGAAGCVEIAAGAAAVGNEEGGEFGADGLDVERHQPSEASPSASFPPSEAGSSSFTSVKKGSTSPASLIVIGCPKRSRLRPAATRIQPSEMPYSS